MFATASKTKRSRAYDRKRTAAGRQQRRLSAAGREIGPLPEPVDPKRRDKCRDDLERALLTYFPGRFTLPFSRDHRAIIQAAEQAMRTALLLAIALPRGFGKTTICECVVILAVLFAYHRYAALIAATQQFARRRLESIRTELETNDLLLADFPAAVYPLRRLAGINQRARGQLLAGKPTRIKLSATRIVLPTVEGATTSEAVIECGSLLGAVRGMNYTTSTGEIIRPTFAMIDDPQTRRSARSKTQTDQREQIVAGDVLYLAGPDQRISAVCPLTVIEPDDLADRLLDRTRHSMWRGIRGKMLYAFPSDVASWDTYADRLAEDLANGGDGSTASSYYKRHRKKMDKGAKVAWPEKVPDGLVSALEHAMRLYYGDPGAFAAEAQNDPQGDQDETADQLTASQVADLASGYGRGEIAAGGELVTAHIDIQKRVLFWLVAAWSRDFTGQVIDYGTWPKQQRRHFTLSSLRQTLASTYPGQLEAQILAGLGDLVAYLCERKFERDDGAQLTIDRAGIDANWGESTDTVYSFCRQTTRPVWPMHGIAIGGSSKPFHQRRRARGDRIGTHWKMPAARKSSRYLLVDVNWWKTFVARRLATPAGERGALTLFKDKHPHRLLAEHLTSEYPVDVVGPFGRVSEWKLRPGRENHWLDDLVGAAALASVLGAELEGHQAPKRKRRQRQSVTYL